MKKSFLFLALIFVVLSFDSCIGGKVAEKGYKTNKSCCGCGAYGNP